MTKAEDSYPPRPLSAARGAVRIGPQFQEIDCLARAITFLLSEGLLTQTAGLLANQSGGTTQIAGRCSRRIGCGLACGTSFPKQIAPPSQSAPHPRWGIGVVAVGHWGKTVVIFNAGISIRQTRCVVPKLDRIVFESIGFFCPGFTDGFERREPIQSLQSKSNIWVCHLAVGPKRFFGRSQNWMPLSVSMV